MTLLVGFFLLSISFSFLCSILEAVLLSVTPSYIKRKEQEGDSISPLLSELKRDIDRPLSAILTLNTIAHTVGAIGVGAQAGKLFGSKSMDLWGLHVSFESIVAVLMTLGILFLSEIIPKTIGANNWKSLAPITARTLKGLMWILHPFVWISNLITRTLKTDKKESVLSKKDFAAMVELANEGGGINNEDMELIKNVLRFDDLKVEDVMTPRTVIMMADENLPLQSYYDDKMAKTFSRIPLYSEDKDHVTGILLKDDLLHEILKGNGDKKLKDIRHEAIFIQDGQSLRDAFKLIHDKNKHLALINDQYGGIMGLVTMEDIFETLFGLEIMDESDNIEDLQKFARQKWEERAKKIGFIGQ